MHRPFDFTPSDPDALVSRVLMQVHSAIDDAFPNAEPSSSRFAKTAFSGYDEPTLTQLGSSTADALREAAEAAALEESMAQEPGLRKSMFSGQSAKRQTMIGLALFLIVAIIAYFVS